MSIIRKIDEVVIVGLQNAYLWLLDRTGIYVATVSLLLFAASLCCLNWSEMGAIVKALLVLLIFANMILIGQRYMLQGRGDDKKYNAMAMGYIDGIYIRWFFNIQMLIFLGSNTVRSDWQYALMDVLILVYNYTPGIMIRDRDKKPFFERKVQLATEGA